MGYNRASPTVARLNKTVYHYVPKYKDHLCINVESKRPLYFVSGIPYRTVYITLLGRLSVVDVSTVGMVSVPKKTRRWKYLAESFPKTYRSASCGTLLVVEQSSLEKPPQGCVVRTVVYGNTQDNTPSDGFRKITHPADDFRKVTHPPG